MRQSGHAQVRSLATAVSFVQAEEVSAGERGSALVHQRQTKGRHKMLRPGRMCILQKAAQARRIFFSAAGMPDKEKASLQHVPEWFLRQKGGHFA